MKKNLMHHRQEHRWKAILNGEKRVKVSSKAEQYLIKALHIHKDTVAVIDTRTTCNDEEILVPCTVYCIDVYLIPISVCFRCRSVCVHMRACLICM